MRFPSNCNSTAPHPISDSCTSTTYGLLKLGILINRYTDRLMSFAKACSASGVNTSFLRILTLYQVCERFRHRIKSTNKAPIEISEPQKTFELFHWRGIRPVKDCGHLSVFHVYTLPSAAVPGEGEFSLLFLHTTHDLHVPQTFWNATQTYPHICVTAV